MFLEAVCNSSSVAAPKRKSGGLVWRQEQSTSDFSFEESCRWLGPSYLQSKAKRKKGQIPRFPSHSMHVHHTTWLKRARLFAEAIPDPCLKGSARTIVLPGCRFTTFNTILSECRLQDSRSLSVPHTEPPLELSTVPSTSWVFGTNLMRKWTGTVPWHSLC